MLKVKKLMCFFSIIFLFNTYNLNTITLFNPLATEVIEDKNIEMVHTDEAQLIEDPIEEESDKIKAEELEKKKNDDLNKEKIKADEYKKEEDKKKEPEQKEFILTFYTSLESENSSAGAVTCQNKPLTPGGVANNVIPQNTKIYLQGYGQVVVNDRGSDKYFSVDNRLDVYIEREPGESDRQYSRRVNNYGVQKVKGYIIK